MYTICIIMEKINWVLYAMLGLLFYFTGSFIIALLCLLHAIYCGFTKYHVLMFITLFTHFVFGFKTLLWMKLCLMTIIMVKYCDQICAIYNIIQAGVNGVDENDKSVDKIVLSVKSKINWINTKYEFVHSKYIFYKTKLIEPIDSVINSDKYVQYENYITNINNGVDMTINVVKCNMLLFYDVAKDFPVFSYVYSECYSWYDAGIKAHGLYDLYKPKESTMSHEQKTQLLSSTMGAMTKMLEGLGANDDGLGTNNVNNSCEIFDEFSLDEDLKNIPSDFNLFGMGNFNPDPAMMKNMLEGFDKMFTQELAKMPDKNISLKPKKNKHKDTKTKTP
jgi:hypothetical protein